MTGSDAELKEAVESLNDRDVRALTEYLLAVADGEGLYRVYSEDGTEYRVDAREGRCTCPDAEHRDPEGGCKHVRRVAFATGERPIPEWADRDALDPRLRDREGAAGGAQAVAADGGTVTADPATDAPDADLPPVTEHREPPAQGGERYVRCEGCGREVLCSLGGRGNLLHRVDCPRGERR